jgi:hypothetical protein
LKDSVSAREAARYVNKDRKTIAKMLRHELPPTVPGSGLLANHGRERISVPKPHVAQFLMIMLAWWTLSWLATFL